MAKLFAGDTIGPAYAEHLKKEHHGSKWGTTGWKYAGDLLVKCISTRPYIQTALDFGCGKGTMKPFLLERFPELQVDEYDPGIPGKDVMPEKQYDLVFTSDVLEHVEPHLLDDTIRKLASMTKFVLFNDIACSPTFKTFGEGPYIGQDLHLTVEEPVWWRERFAEVAGLHEAEYQHREKASNKGRKPRCLLIHERV